MKSEETPSRGKPRPKYRDHRGLPIYEVTIVNPLDDDEWKKYGLVQADVDKKPLSP